MDEAFVDLGDMALDEAVQLTQQIRDEVLQETRLTVSAGVSTGKLIAKIASDSCKPNGLLAIGPGEEESFLAPLPVGRLWGIGPKTAARLQTFGITTIGQVAALDDPSLKQLFGSWGVEVRDLARGIDQRPVEADRETKSISSEETFEYDVRDEKQLISVLREQTLDIVRTLDRENLSASTVGVKIKRADFRVFGRQTHLIEPTRDAKRIFRAAVHCLRRAELNGAPVRLLGLRVASLTEGEAKQISLFGGGD
jgi:DNA polymerase-4